MVTVKGGSMRSSGGMTPKAVCDDRRHGAVAAFSARTALVPGQVRGSYVLRADFPSLGAGWIRSGVVAQNCRRLRDDR